MNQTFKIANELPTRIRTLTIIILLLLCGCQNSPPVDLPTLVIFPTQSIPTITPRLLASVTPTVTVTLSATATITSTPEADLTHTPVARIPATATLSPTLLPEVFVFGNSVEGRALTAYRFGSGSITLLLVGGIHAGFEANSTVLLQEIIATLRANPAAILPELNWLIIPELNPDGSQKGRVLAGRFNGHGVDLNRNWACDWSATAEWKHGASNPGNEPFSEPETRALGALIQLVKPEAVLFYHAAANAVVAGECNDSQISHELASQYSDLSNYPLVGDALGNYEVTGSAEAWIASLGIPAITIELATSDLPETNRNFQALVGLQEWLRLWVSLRP